MSSESFFSRNEEHTLSKSLKKEFYVNPDEEGTVGEESERMNKIIGPSAITRSGGSKINIEILNEKERNERMRTLEILLNINEAISEKELTDRINYLENELLQLNERINQFKEYRDLNTMHCLSDKNEAPFEGNFIIDYKLKTTEENNLNSLNTLLNESGNMGSSHKSEAQGPVPKELAFISSEESKDRKRSESNKKYYSKVLIKDNASQDEQGQIASNEFPDDYDFSKVGIVKLIYERWITRPHCVEKILMKMKYMAYCSINNPEKDFSDELLQLFESVEERFASGKEYSEELKRVNFLNVVRSIQEKNWKKLAAVLENFSRSFTILFMEEIREYMGRIHKVSEKIKDKHVVLLLGDTGSGKSTLCHYLSGSKMEMITKDGINVITPVSNDSDPSLIENVKTSNSIDSETRFIYPVKISLKDPAINPSDEGIYLLDSPGFEDTRGPEIDITNVIGLIKSIKRTKSIRMVGLISYYSIGSRFQGIKKIAHLIGNMFPDVTSHKNSLTFFFTKFVDNEFASFKRHIKEFRKDLSSNETHYTREILKILELSCSELNVIEPLKDSARNFLLKEIFQLNKFISTDDILKPFLTMSSHYIYKKKLIYLKEAVQKAFNQNELGLAKSLVKDINYLEQMLETNINANSINSMFASSSVSQIFQEKLKRNQDEELKLIYKIVNPVIWPKSVINIDENSKPVQEILNLYLEAVKKNIARFRFYEFLSENNDKKERYSSGLAISNTNLITKLEEKVNDLNNCLRDIRNIFLNEVITSETSGLSETEAKALYAYCIESLIKINEESNLESIFAGQLDESEESLSRDLSNNNKHDFFLHLENIKEDLSKLRSLSKTLGAKVKLSISSGYAMNTIITTSQTLDYINLFLNSFILKEWEILKNALVDLNADKEILKNFIELAKHQLGSLPEVIGSSLSLLRNERLKSFFNDVKTMTELHSPQEIIKFLENMCYPFSFIVSEEVFRINFIQKLREELLEALEAASIKDSIFEDIIESLLNRTRLIEFADSLQENLYQIIKKLSAAITGCLEYFLNDFNWNKSKNILQFDFKIITKLHELSEFFSKNQFLIENKRIFSAFSLSAENLKNQLKAKMLEEINQICQSLNEKKINLLELSENEFEKIKKLRGFFDQYKKIFHADKSENVENFGKGLDSLINDYSKNFLKKIIEIVKSPSASIFEELKYPFTQLSRIQENIGPISCELIYNFVEAQSIVQRKLKESLQIFEIKDLNHFEEIMKPEDLSKHLSNIKDADWLRGVDKLAFEDFASELSDLINEYVTPMLRTLKDAKISYLDSKNLKSLSNTYNSIVKLIDLDRIMFPEKEEMNKFLQGEQNSAADNERSKPKRLPKRMNKMKETLKARLLDEFEKILNLISLNDINFECEIFNMGFTCDPMKLSKALIFFKELDFEGLEFTEQDENKLGKVFYCLKTEKFEHKVRKIFEENITKYFDYLYETALFNFATAIEFKIQDKDPNEWSEYRNENLKELVNPEAGLSPKSGGSSVNIMPQKISKREIFKSLFSYSNPIYPFLILKFITEQYIYEYQLSESDMEDINFAKRKILRRKSDLFHDKIKEMQDLLLQPELMQFFLAGLPVRLNYLKAITHFLQDYLEMSGKAIKIYQTRRCKDRQVSILEVWNAFDKIDDLLKTNFKKMYTETVKDLKENFQKDINEISSLIEINDFNNVNQILKILSLNVDDDSKLMYKKAIEELARNIERKIKLINYSIESFNTGTLENYNEEKGRLLKTEMDNLKSASEILKQFIPEYTSNSINFAFEKFEEILSQSISDYIDSIIINFMYSRYAIGKRESRNLNLLWDLLKDYINKDNKFNKDSNYSIFLSDNLNVKNTNDLPKLKILKSHEIAINNLKSNMFSKFPFKNKERSRNSSLSEKLESLKSYEKLVDELILNNYGTLDKISFNSFKDLYENFGYDSSFDLTLKKLEDQLNREKDKIIEFCKSNSEPLKKRKVALDQLKNKLKYIYPQMADLWKKEIDQVSITWENQSKDSLSYLLNLINLKDDENILRLYEKVYDSNSAEVDSHLKDYLLDTSQEFTSIIKDLEPKKCYQEMFEYIEKFTNFFDRWKIYYQFSSDIELQYKQVAILLENKILVYQQEISGLLGESPCNENKLSNILDFYYELTKLAIKFSTRDSNKNLLKNSEEATKIIALPKSSPDKKTDGESFFSILFKNIITINIIKILAEFKSSYEEKSNLIHALRASPSGNFEITRANHLITDLDIMSKNLDKLLALDLKIIEVYDIELMKEHKGMIKELVNSELTKIKNSSLQLENLDLNRLLLNKETAKTKELIEEAYQIYNNLLVTIDINGVSISRTIISNFESSMKGLISKISDNIKTSFETNSVTTIDNWVEINSKMFLLQNVKLSFGKNENFNDLLKEVDTLIIDLPLKFFYQMTETFMVAFKKMNPKILANNFHKLYTFFLHSKIQELKEPMKKQLIEFLKEYEFRTDNDKMKKIELASALEQIDTVSPVIFNDFSYFKELLLFNFYKNIKRIKIDDFLNSMKLFQGNENCDFLSLKQSFISVMTEYEDVLYNYKKTYPIEFQALVSEIRSKASNFEKNSFNWLIKRKEKMLSLIAHVLALWSLTYSFGSTEDNIPTPHPGQIIAILNLLCLCQNKGLEIRNNIQDLKPGDGKTVVIALTAAILAITGVEVYCISYNEILSKRDFSSFQEFFRLLNLENLIVYQTLNRVSEDLINGIGNLNKVVEKFLSKGNLAESEASPFLVNKTNRVLLMDEVDALFSPDFYGKIYQPVAKWRHYMISNFFHFVWNNRTKVNYEFLSNSTPFKLLLKNFPSLENLLNEILLDICYDLTNFETHSWHCKQGSICYMDQGEINFNIQFGYQTTFAHFKEHSSNKISVETLNKSLFFRVNCGNFSYSEIPRQFNLVLGVSGVTQILNNEQIALLNYKYNINTFNRIPPIFNEDRLRSPHLLKISNDESEHFKDIVGELKKIIDIKGACFIFFDNEKQLLSFRESDIFVEYKDFAKYLVDNSSQENLELTIRLAAKSGQITLFTRSFARGTDLQFKAGTINYKSAFDAHIIQTYIADDPAEDMQLKGRIARIGFNGSYSIIINHSSLKKFTIKGESFHEIRYGMDLRSLVKIRDNLFLHFCSETNEFIKRSLKNNKDSFEFVKNLSANKKKEIVDFLIKENKGITELKANSEIRSIFLIDATPSMGYFLRIFKYKLPLMLQNLQTILSQHQLNHDILKFKFIVYRDYSTGHHAIIQESIWTSKKQEMQSFLNTVSPIGGINNAAIELGLWHANEESKAKQVDQIFLIAANLPNTKEEVKVQRSNKIWSKTKYSEPTNYGKEIFYLQKKRIKVHSSYFQESKAFVFQSISEKTGGVSNCIDLEFLDGKPFLENFIIEVLRMVGARIQIGKSSDQTLIKEYQALKNSPKFMN